AARVDQPDHGGARDGVPAPARVRNPGGREGAGRGRAAPPHHTELRGRSRGDDDGRRHPEDPRLGRSPVSAFRAPRNERAPASDAKRPSANGLTLSAEFLRKLRRIELNTRKVINSTFVGEYKSTFKGTGMEFVDVREYLPGDDVRSIDWNVTARMDRPFLKKVVEEGELTVILCIDASGSGYFGTRSQFKLEQSAQVAATIAFSAVTNNDKVGLLFFTDEVERYIPPCKGKQHVLRLIRDILMFQPRRRGTNPVAALEFVMHLLKQKAIVFLISDFRGAGSAPERVRIPLGIAARRHDVVAIPITDPAEAQLPRVGLVDLEDMETGERVTVDTSHAGLRKRYEQHMQTLRAGRDRLFTRLGIDCIPLRTDEDFTPKLHKFFQLRARRGR